MDKAFAQGPGEKYQYDSSTVQDHPAEVVPLRPYENSGLSLRALAFALDQAILIVPSIIFSAVCAGIIFIGLTSFSLAEEFVKAVSIGGSIASYFAVHWLYFTLSESSTKQATLGQSILGIKVEKEEGGCLKFYEANNRYWCWFFGSLLFGINFLGFLGEKKGFFHDKISKSYVVIDS